MIRIMMIATLFQACSTESPVPVRDDGQPWESAIQLNIGNYWVYESRNQFGTLAAINPPDSTYVSGDSLFRGHTYYHVGNDFGLSMWLADSSDCIIDATGHIQFSALNTTDTLFSSASETGLMGGRTEVITVPAGTFSTIYFYVVQDTPAALRDPNLSGLQPFVVRKVWYAQDIGVVKDVFYYDNVTSFERNLIRFHVNPR